MNKIIGGEFEISPDLLQINNKTVNYFNADYFFSTGRSALYNILKNENSNVVLIPKHICQSVPDTIMYVGKIFSYYTVDRNFNFYFEHKKNAVKNPIVIIVNFFGLVDVDAMIEHVKSIYEDPVIILDDVQALWDLQEAHKADYTFCSFRKWLSVPDGAPVKTKKSFSPAPLQKNEFAIHKVTGSLLKFYRTYDEINDNDYLSQFEQGEKMLNENWNCEMSSFTKNILNNLDYQKIADTRKENARYLFSIIEQTKIDLSLMQEKLQDDTFVPMFVPVFIENRDAIRNILMQNNIFCPVHWHIETDLAKNILSLVIDQRYDYNDMEKIAIIINENVKV